MWPCSQWLCCLSGWNVLLSRWDWLVRNCALISSLTCFYWTSIQALVISYTEGLNVFCVFAPGPWGYSLPWWGESCHARPRRGREGGRCCPWLQPSCSLERGWALKQVDTCLDLSHFLIFAPWTNDHFWASISSYVKCGEYRLWYGFYSLSRLYFPVVSNVVIAKFGTGWALEVLGDHSAKHVTINHGAVHLKPVQNVIGK